ncbi:uncharacterized protein LOC102809329 [Saccoglossus kowalevskii]|uniref:Uncharacterized protein LOC102809329 n=1 Tax=Saccoglossus kowalevskii TaxID=10224 RepID=A0ABM0MXH2_SACKO|nr:PREDICTED: uncharacterized protein LOC102809329 [Saccoglossus kowalevskii]
MEALWQLEAPTDDVDSLLHFSDTLESHIRGLQSLGRDESTYGELLVPIILRKLPKNICVQLARSHGNSAWNITDLRADITGEINALKAGMNDVNIGGQMSRPISAFHTPSSGSRSQQPRLCIFCKGTHHPNECNVVTDAKKRLEIVKRDRLCYNCLSKHLVSDCTSRFTCKHCNKKYHSSLHFPERTRQQSTTPNVCADFGQANVSTSTQNANDTRVHLATPRLRKSTGPVLLRTAVIPISTESNGNLVHANVLFDEGATRTFATQKFAEKISLRSTNKESVNLATLGHQDKYPRSLNTGTVNLHTLTGDKTAINVLLIPEISDNLTHHVNSDLLTLPYLRDLTLAHPVSNGLAFDIDILIGADYYWDLIGDQIIRGSGPTAVSSVFGYLLSGPKNNGQTTTDAHVLHTITDTRTEEKAIASYRALETIGGKTDKYDECKQILHVNINTHDDTDITSTIHDIEILDDGITDQNKQRQVAPTFDPMTQSVGHKNH